MARPPGEIRLMVLKAVADISASQDGLLTTRDVMARLIPRQVGRLAVRRTLEDLVRAGLLVRVSWQPVKGVCKPLAVYRYVDHAPKPAAPAGADLAQALGGWFGGAPANPKEEEP